MIMLQDICKSQKKASYCCIITSKFLVPFIFIYSVIIALSGCQQSGYKPPANPLFVEVSTEQSGLDFRNDIEDDSVFNEITYRNFYNGGGVAIGDINNDGFADVFMTANQGENKLFLNKGNFSFQDITNKAGISKKNKWSTGVTMADVNADGLLDIYVCTAGNVAGDERLNELYVNEGNSTFKEEARKYNLQDSGAFHTQAAFFDYDLDGDLDVFLLNNNCLMPVGSYGMGAARHIDSPVDGDKLLRNDNGFFTDASKEAGIFRSSFGFGLGVTVGDINRDNWPDLYISNDFFEKDYLYVNQRNGSFKEVSDSCIGHMSQSSMGADMADINNDGLIDIFSTDMLPENDYRLKKNTAFEDYDTYQSKIRAGFHRQLLSNMLHLNNGDNTFSEIAQFAGVDATDWSWGALIFDFNNDGWKDIMVCNGMYLDVTDQDYIAYTADQDRKQLFKKNRGGNDYKLLKKMIVSQPIPNYAFVNQKNLRFKNMSYELGLAKPGFSNGASYADLDNDGDIDIVVNNLNDKCSVFKNTIGDKEQKSYLQVKLQGEGQNKFGIGAMVTVYTKGLDQNIQNFPTRGFQSCVESVLNFGLDETKSVDSIKVLWPNNKLQLVKDIQANTKITLYQKNAQQEFTFPSHHTSTLLEQITPTAITGNISHAENDFVDFDLQRLMPHLLSTEGPKLSVADINGDGLDDLFMGAAKHDTSKIFIQDPNGNFIPLVPQPAFITDKEYEDAGSCFIDIDKDGDQDLIVSSGGNLEQDGSELYQVRLYINNGKGLFTRQYKSLPDIRLNASCIMTLDYDEDGDEDLFIGGRSIPLVFGAVPESFILKNENGTFRKETGQAVLPLQKIGMVTDAVWQDVNGDGHKELLVVGEWMPITIFSYHQQQKKFVATTINNSSGWWNCIEAADIDRDGDIDFVAGNLGLNSKIKGDSAHPAKLYVNDFDNNGRKECVVSLYKSDGKEYPYYLRPDLTAQLPYLKKQFLTFAAYAGKTVDETFSLIQLQSSEFKKSNEYRSCVFVNNGSGNFLKKPLPFRAQLSPMYALIIDDINKDGLQDIISGGNLYGLKPELGRYDADYGTVLLGNKNNEFDYLTPHQSGFFYQGQVRDIVVVNTFNNKMFIVSKNNENLMIFGSRVLKK